MISEEKERLLKFFAEGRMYYKLMDFRQALLSFQKARRINPEDGPSKVYEMRCRYFIKNPPDPDWDGIFVMQDK